MGAVIPCTFGDPWTGDSMELVPLKPNSTRLELAILLTGAISRVFDEGLEESTPLHKTPSIRIGCAHSLSLGKGRCQHSG